MGGRAVRRGVVPSVDRGHVAVDRRAESGDRENDRDDRRVDDRAGAAGGVGPGQGVAWAPPTNAFSPASMRTGSQFCFGGRGHVA